jgi:hypothetical protein
MSELLGNETPAEVEKYWKDRRAAEATEREKRAFDERAARDRQSSYTPPKDVSEMTPPEMEQHRLGLIEQERADAATRIETQRKDRARRAYVASTGSEEGFDGIYTASLRKKMVEAETLAALEDDGAAVGETTSDGLVRW